MHYRGHVYMHTEKLYTRVTHVQSGLNNYSYKEKP